MKHKEQDILQYPVVPCRMCGVPLMGHAWHCVGCQEHWPLTREQCGTCKRERCFEFLATIPTSLYLDDFERLPDVVTIVPTLEDYAEYHMRNSEGEET
jgi:hypothetical protein